MKNIILILFISLALSCKAQSPIIAYNSSHIPENEYCKDLNNDLNKFVGTWKYENGTTELTVVIVKNEQVDLDEYYIDELAGNYKYVENGNEIVDTLNYDYGEDSAFSGDEMSTDTNSFIIAHFFDPGKSRASYKLDIKYLGLNPSTGEIRMEWKLSQTGFDSSFLPGETPPTSTELDHTMRLPAELILVKQ